jgi:mannobiose 2-epimerase
MYATKTSVEQLNQLYKEMEWEMNENILPFWMRKVADHEIGGFFGRVTNDGIAVKDAPKGAVLNARILWTFSAAYNLTGRTEYLEYAQRAYTYFTKYFIDSKCGGVVWSITANGEILNDRKQIYAQAFAIYAFAEFYLATGEQESILLASDLYGFIEKHAFDTQCNGYIEARSREWEPLEDLRLSEKDANEPKSMNTHLHILEAYTKLFEVWKDDELGKSLYNLIKIHTDKILSAKNGHFNLFFDMDWNPKSEQYSFGHDIEGAWLITEAARVLGIKVVAEQAEHLAVIMAGITLQEGIAEDGSLYNEGLKGLVIDTDRHWWPQAEAIIGFINAWEISKNPKFLIVAQNTWHFIKSRMRHPSGEWWWLVNKKYEPDHSQDLAGEWKCPYHNSRCSIEAMKRISKHFACNYPELFKSLSGKI